ncbi:IS66 family transposase [Candidatus Bipolaricaulota bacterium]|nr:IS66 family transposase [Candidatus Bipolaricaulota bacterium]
MRPSYQELEKENQRLRRENQKLRARLARLERENRALKKRLEQLEAELRRGRRQAAPFSRDEPKAEPKRPGRRPGQGQFSWRKPPPEEEIQETIEVPLPRCPDCGGPLVDRATHEQIQIELPETKPRVIRFRTESGYCPRCKRRVRARHPDQVSEATGAAGVCLGPRAVALAADMKHRLGIPYRKISQLYELAFGLEVTAGALCQADARLAKKAEPIYRELVEAIRQSAAVYADETGWRIGVLSAWLWVFTSQRITVYTIEERRSHEVVVEILGRKFRGVLVSDCFTAYDAKELEGWLKQKCFAHMLRELAKLEREKSQGAVRFPRELLKVLREALKLREEKPWLSEAEFRARLLVLEEKLDALIAEGRHFTDPDNARLAKRLRKQRKHLFTFLELDGVESTNNRAERALRPAVVVRKTGGCNRTARGARTHAVLASLVVTARQQGLDPVNYLAQVLTAGGKPSPLSLERPPPLPQLA